MMDLNAITSDLIGGAIRVHQALGPGLLESVYQRCLALELRAMEMSVECERPVPIEYRGHKIHDEGFRIDLLVEDVIVVELKSVEKLLPVHKKQLLTYLRLADRKLGLLINFNVPLLKDGIVRVVDGDISQETCAPHVSECDF